jgi:hypothetical protein
MCLTLPVACGDDDDDSGKPPANSAGAGGEATGRGGETASEGGGGAGGAAPAIMIPGTTPTAQTVTCGTNTCKSVSTISPAIWVDPCCTADEECGVSTGFFAVVGASFKDTCQAKGQVGPVDTGCPTSAAQMLPLNGTTYMVPGFAGCCRADTGTCGVVVDKVSVTGIPLPFTSPGLGCVDSAPFFKGVEGKACGDTSMGGAGGVSGGAGGADAGGAATGGAGGAK